MKNGDQPAFAQSFAADKDGNMYAANEKDSTNGGLTKREYFAAMVASGKNGNPVEIAEHAILVADELLKQLETK